MMTTPSQALAYPRKSWHTVSHSAKINSNTPKLRSPTTTTLSFSTPDNMADALKDSPIKAVQVEALVCCPRTLCLCPTSPSDFRRL